MEPSLDAAERIILRWDSTASEDARERMIFDSPRDEVDRFLLAVDQIQRSFSDLNHSNLSSAVQIAMARLEDEFRNILLHHNAAPLSSRQSFTTEDDFSLDEDDDVILGGALTPRADVIDDSTSYRSTCSIKELNLLPSDAVADLRSIVERMIAGGYLRECIQVYGGVRKSAVDSSFRRLGIEKLSIGHVQRLQWDQLEAKIRRWIRAVVADI